MAELAVAVPDVPPRIGRHEVLGFLASGGMSELFLGREPSGRVVVIKRILPHLSRQSAFVSMFIDEARIGSLIRHDNVVEVYELGQVGSDLFMVMELLEGENASSLVRRLVGRGERLGYGLAAHLIAEACAGLAAAHELCDERGQPLELVHRDVSPQNVFVTYDGAVKVLDFGIAAGAHRLTQTATGQLKGKFAYMSPEQCRGEALDRRSDLFSLGVVLYELTAQRRLFARANELLVLRAVCEDPIPRPSRDRPDYPPFLEDICLRALSRDRDRRYPSAAAMRDDLIAATQLLLGATSPREALAAEMQRLFAERIAAKAQMLGHARAGTDPGVLPSLDADEGVVVPEASPVTPADGSRPSPAAVPATASPDDPVGPAPSRRRRVGPLVAVVALAAAAAAFAMTWRGADDAPASRPLDRPADATSPPGPVAPPGAPPAAAAAVATAVIPPAPPARPATAAIAIRLETTPPGAEVTVDDVVVGETPFELELARGGAPARVELRRRGYQTVRRTVLADRDQALTFELRRRTGGAGRKPGGAPGREPDRGFHRFE